MANIPKQRRLKVRQKAFELFNAGYGYKKAAKELGLELYTVRDWFRVFRGGHSECVLKPRFTKAYDKELKKKIVAERLATEKPFSELSAEYGIPACTIRKWIARLRPEEIAGLLAENEKSREAGIKAAEATV